MHHLQRTIAAAILVGACASEPPTALDALPDQDQTPLMSQGVAVQFMGAGTHLGSGGATLTIEGNRARLELGADFSVDGVPGPYLYLGTTNDPNTGVSLRIAPLRQNSGSQVYTFLIPAGLRFSWVLVWCDPFNVPVAQAPIPASP